MAESRVQSDPGSGLERQAQTTVAVVLVDGRAHTAVIAGLPAEGTRLDLGFSVVVTGSRLLADGMIITAERDGTVAPEA